MDQLLFLADELARFFSGIGQWGAIWFIIAVILFFREEKKDRWFFLPTIGALSFSYLFSELILKNLIMRPRPPGADLETFSFPSTHATIAWSMTYVLWREEPKLRPWFILLATLISLSRIYLGVHYPTDILGGLVLGIIIGWLSLTLESFVRHRLMKKLPDRSKRIR